MTSKAGLAVAVLGVLGCAAIYFHADARFKEVTEAADTLQQRVNQFEDDRKQHDARIAELAGGGAATLTRVAAIEDKRLPDLEAGRVKRLEDRSSALEAALDQQVAAIDSRLTASDAADQGRFRLIEARADRLERDTSKRAAADAAVEKAREDLLAAPGTLLRCTGVQILRRGIINAYSKVTQATLHNASNYTVGDIKGTVEYRQQGKVLGSLPATASGILLAGQSATLSVTVSEIVAAASDTETVFVVTSVSIIGSR